MRVPLPRHLLMARFLNHTGVKERGALRTGKDIQMGLIPESLLFEEGVDAYVPYVGGVSEALASTIQKIKATMINVGASDLSEFKRKRNSNTGL